MENICLTEHDIYKKCSSCCLSQKFCQLNKELLKIVKTLWIYILKSLWHCFAWLSVAAIWKLPNSKVDIADYHQICFFCLQVLPARQDFVQNSFLFVFLLPKQASSLPIQLARQDFAKNSPLFSDKPVTKEHGSHSILDNLDWILLEWGHFFSLC